MRVIVGEIVFAFDSGCESKMYYSRRQRDDILKFSWKYIHYDIRPFDGEGLPHLVNKKEALYAPTVFIACRRNKKQLVGLDILLVKGWEFSNIKN